MFILMMTTATFAGTGITATVQGRVAQVEVVDNNLYSIAVLGDTDRLISTRSMNQRSGVFAVEIPAGNDYIDVVVTNIQTGTTEVITLRVE